MSNLTLHHPRVPNDLLPATQRLSMTTWRQGNRHGVEVMAKQGGEVRWFGEETDGPPSLSRAVEACELQGVALVRPFALGAPFDAGAWHCVAALLRHCLRRLGVSSLEVLLPTTDTEHVLTVGALSRDASVGDWQGVIYPRTWGAPQVRRLCGYLRADCGLPELASRVEALPAEEPAADALF